MRDDCAVQESSCAPSVAPRGGLFVIPFPSFLGTGWGGGGKKKLSVLLVCESAL